MVVNVNNPPNLPGPSAIILILVNITLSETNAQKKNPHVKTEHQIDKQDIKTTITISDLEPEESYNISVSYVTEFGSGEPSEVVKSRGTLDSLRKTDGCIIHNDEKFKTGMYSTGQKVNSIIECANNSAKEPTNVGWSYEFLTRRCFISSEEYTETENEEEEDKEFKLGWASGTLACSEATEKMTSCTKDSDIKGGLLLTGGVGDGSALLDSSEITLLGGTSGCEIPKLPASIQGHVTFVTGDGIVATCGGSTSADLSDLSDKCQVLEIGSGAWEENTNKLNSLPRARTGSSTVTLPIGVYILGGFYGGRGVYGSRSSVFLPAGSAKWQDGPDLPSSYSTIGACAVSNDNDFLLIGGKSDVSVSKAVYQFDPLVNGPSSDMGWFTWPSLNQAKHHHGCAVLGNTVIVAGGIGDYGATMTSTEIIDLTTHMVTKGEDLKTARAYFGMMTLGVVENQFILAFGGQNSENVIHSSVEKLSSKTWESSIKDLKTERSKFGSIAVNVKTICRGAPSQNNMNMGRNNFGSVQKNTNDDDDDDDDDDDNAPGADDDKTVASCSGCKPWGKWEPCLATCGKGKRIRSRSCKSNNGEGDTCQCKTEEEEDCSIGPCPVDGSWSGWSSFSACSTTDLYTCGTKSRTRTCTNPVTMHDGKSCEGRDIEIVGCSGGNKLPLKVLGHCQENQDIDKNIGQEAVDGCFAKPEDCLKTCQENGTATGCEFNIKDRNCYIHTAHITEVNRTATENICWLFIVNEMPGSCTDKLTPISTNITSEACLYSCQTKDDAQGCQYNFENEECSYFTCPMLTASGNKNITCWTFNKGLFKGDQGTNCD